MWKCPNPSISAVKITMTNTTGSAATKVMAMFARDRYSGRRRKSSATGTVMSCTKSAAIPIKPVTVRVADELGADTIIRTRTPIDPSSVHLSGGGNG